MIANYDPQVDALSVRFSDGTGKAPASIEVRPGVYLEFTADEKLVGLEVLNASQHFTAEQLKGWVGPPQLLTLEELETETGIAPATWRVLLNRGRVKGEKKGGTWYVDYAAAIDYMESRAPAGRPAAKKKARRRRKAKEISK